MVPGILILVTFFLMFFLSSTVPTFVAVFIIFYQTYWLLRTVYLFILLHLTNRKMRVNEKINWLQKLKIDFPHYEDIYHVVILPMYDEPHIIVSESFGRLAGSNYPKDKMIVVLATEERAGEAAEQTARKIEADYGDVFYKFLITTHEANLPGEIPGKGSNETWAAKRLKEQIIDPLKIPYENILVSVFDVDSQVKSEYFGVLTHAFFSSPNKMRSSYQPIPVFTNNVFEAPFIARLAAFSSTFWHMMQQNRPESLTTFSSQSIPWIALNDIGFWSTNIVSEDSRIFWQCYMHYGGDWRTVPLFYPISMDANVARTFFKTAVNIYKQQRRWAWGSENIPYILTNFIRNRKIPGKLYWSFYKLEAFHSWATSSIILFALGWLPILLGGEDFHLTVLSYNLPRITGSIMIFANIGIASSAILSVILLPPKPDWFRPRHYIYFVLQWIFMPISFIFFGSLPSIEAQLRLMLGGRFRLGFWVTPKMRRSEAVIN